MYSTTPNPQPKSKAELWPLVQGCHWDKGVQVVLSKVSAHPSHKENLCHRCNQIPAPVPGA